MSTVQQYLDYSTLSFAAYGKSLTFGMENNTASLKAADMVQPQIDQLIANGWEVVDQSSDALYGSSGFSATLFQNTQTGEFVFANRGTDEFVSDLLGTDLWGIVVNGAAGTQIIDMYRYYKQLITPKNQAVTYTAEEIEKLRAIGGAYHLPFNTTALVENYLQNDVGLGKISPTQTFSTGTA